VPEIDWNAFAKTAAASRLRQTAPRALDPADAYAMSEQARQTAGAMVMDAVALAFMVYGHDVSTPSSNITDHRFAVGRLTLRARITRHGRIVGVLSQSAQPATDGGARVFSNALEVDLLALVWDPAARSYLASDGGDPVPSVVEAILDRIGAG